MREWVSVCLSILIALAARKSSNIDCLFQVFARGSEPDQTWTYNSWSRHCANSLATLLEYRDRLRQARDLPCDRRTSRSLGVNPAWVWMCVCVCLCATFLLRGSCKWLSKMRQTQTHTATQNRLGRTHLPSPPYGNRFAYGRGWVFLRDSSTDACVLLSSSICDRRRVVAYACGFLVLCLLCCAHILLVHILWLRDGRFIKWRVKIQNQYHSTRAHSEWCPIAVVDHGRGVILIWLRAQPNCLHI